MRNRRFLLLFLCALLFPTAGVVAQAPTATPSFMGEPQQEWLADKTPISGGEVDQVVAFMERLTRYSPADYRAMQSSGNNNPAWVSRISADTRAAGFRSLQDTYRSMFRVMRVYAMLENPNASAEMEAARQQLASLPAEQRAYAEQAMKEASKYLYAPTPAERNLVLPKKARIEQLMERINTLAGNE